MKRRRSHRSTPYFVLGNHALELHQQLVLGARALRRFDEQRLNPVSGERMLQQSATRQLGSLCNDLLELPIQRQSNMCNVFPSELPKK